MKLIYLLLKLLYINRTAYAINEYNYIDKGNSKYNSDYYRIEKVIVKEIFFNTMFNLKLQERQQEIIQQDRFVM